jgi:MFS family permease
MVGVALRRTVQDHRFVRLVSARTISVLGNGFSLVALAFVLVGGVVADRVSRYRLMVGAELLAGFAWLAITAMIFTGYAPLPLLGLAAVVAGVGTAMLLPALNGVLPEFVSGERLQSAKALLRIGLNSAMVLGLSLSGLVVAAAGASWALAVNAASFLLSAALIWGMKLPARPWRPAPNVGRAAPGLGRVCQGGGCGVRDRLHHFCAVCRAR